MNNNCAGCKWDDTYIKQCATCHDCDVDGIDMAGPGCNELRIVCPIKRLHGSCSSSKVEVNENN